MLKKIFTLLLPAFVAHTLWAQSESYDAQVREYISQFREFAIQEQLRSGVPASITLAQGVFETAAGSSELCTNAQNHFGIKCKNTWTGDTYLHTDDAKDECFRKYESAAISYSDHSDFLKANKRYASLFLLDPSDYKGWAFGLKKCGYATNPKYALKLIELVENYNLQDYTYAALGRKKEGNAGVMIAAAAPVAATPGENIPEHDEARDPALAVATPGNDWEIVNTENPAPQEKETGTSVVYYEPLKLNGMRGFYARKGDMLLEYAIKNRVRYARLLEMNDLPDAPLEADMFIYLEKKRKTATNPTHVVREGETMLQISQQEGIQLEQLRLLNHLGAADQPAAGTELNLQTMTASRPAVAVANAPQEETVSIGYGAARPSRVKAEKPNTDNEWVEVVKDERPIPEELKPEVTEENIASLKAVEEEMQEAKEVPQEAKQQQPMSELDRLKARMDQSVYGGEKQPAAASKAQQNKPVQQNEEEEEEITTVPAHVQNQINKDPQAALRRHMDSVEGEDDFQPKRNEDHTKLVRNTPATPKATAKKKVTSKKGAVKKKTGSKGKSTAKKKPVAKKKK